LSGTNGMALPRSGDPLPAPVVRGIPAGARAVVILTAILIAPAAIAAGLTLGSPSALGVLGGGLVGLVNFWVLSRLVVKATSGEDDVHWATLSARLFFKFALLGACLWALIVPLQLEFLGVVLGLSLVMFAAIGSQVIDLVR